MPLKNFKIAVEKIFDRTTVIAMSSDFGKQFIDARNASGITLEEVANATNIRHDYLACIENGEYDFGLPEIYVRGFIKIYAKYLRLDVDAVMANCPIRDFEVLNSKIGKRISYNTIIAGEKEQEENSNVSVNDDIPVQKKLKFLWDGIRQSLAGKPHGKILVFFLGALVIILILCKIFPRGSVSTEMLGEQVSGVSSVPSQSTVSLIATGHVKVVVREKSSGTKLFSGDLESGSVRKITHAKPIQIFYDSGEFLLIKQANGEQLYPQPGRGGIEIK
ncbi:MAG: helix-turn-helix domain-containing protein [Puniceicoccales bacterium]|jgi:transcriptional regulator with XRE-family HTH domain|nr:helix-turn-helix domain-containing protein [Puniceicoccales bacterium]